MAIFSILLIENQVSVAAAIVEAIKQHLSNYRITVTLEIMEAAAKLEPAHVILLGLAQLADDVCQKLTSLSAVYPDTPLILLQETLPATATAEVEEQALLEALAWGAGDYVTLSKAGLLALGKRLERLQNAWQAQQRQAEIKLTSGELLYKAIVSDTSQLAIQLISPDNHIHAWNRAAEMLFGLKKQSPNSSLIESLPLSPSNLGRLKDVLEQVRASGESLFIPNFSLETHQGQTHWVQLHLYPITTGSPEGQPSDIC
ncbi:MAG TPA: PAS domain S-box protein, partial [Anaerolineae bacterium]|nr:PAS domain S-box protein [Anaerolineae bacterium]